MSADSIAANARSWRWLDCVIVLVLSALSAWHFVRRGPTAFEWPGTDMACFFERAADPNFLPHDYYTNSVSQPNPRFVFGYFVLSLAWLTGSGWYDVYYALRAVFTWTVPGLWYLALLGVLKPRLADDRAQLLARVVLTTALVLVMRRDINNWFSIAWWPPFFIYVGAHPLALWLSLTAIVMRTQETAWARRASLAVWCCASLVHPTIGLFLVVFYWLATFDARGWRETAAEAVCAVIVPFVALAALFGAGGTISGAEFVNLYVVNSHPFHYQVSHFATLTKHPWWVSFSLVLGLMTAAGLVGLARRNRTLSVAAALFASAYGGCVAVQWLGTDVWPSRAVATLGPSRFSFLGFFFLSILAVLVTLELWPRRVAAAERRASRTDRWLDKLTPLHAACVLTIGIVATIANCKDNPFQTLREPALGLYEWMDRNTDPDAVFLPPFNHPLHREIPIIGRRSVYASQGFPFREDILREQVERQVLAYGRPEEVDHLEGKNLFYRRLNFYLSLGPKAAFRLGDKYRLDYVIVERGHPSAFDGQPCCYADTGWMVYDVRALREPDFRYEDAPTLPVITATNTK